RLEAARLAPDLHDPQNAAAYLAIGPDDLLDPLAPLLDWRREHGLTALTIPLQAVYDQFNAGIPDPAAIRKLVAATVAWKESPRYLLLVGDASYDPQGYLAPAEANRLPTFFVDTMFGGQTGSDIPFGQELAPGASASEVDPQAATRLAVGRFPARNARQVTILVEKTLQFERALLDGGLPRSVAAVADGQEPVYRREAQAFLEQFPASYTTGLYSPEAGVSEANKEVIALFEGGELFVAYFGHGSLNMWGKDMLFTSQDVEALSNAGRLPVVINMTCLTGLFTHPTQESLAEALLWKDDGGAVAVLAPTSLTLPLDQSDLSDAIVAQLAGAEQPPLGDVLAAARNQIESTEPSMLDVLLTFMLFGDPALSLPGG
ncbi:MAG: C25 family cysteine peptidase, partial [Anaerolineales bacterium]|nr:C25 family cysteine peptidase [Anaerolineales bacterium]